MSAASRLAWCPRSHRNRSSVDPDVASVAIVSAPNVRLSPHPARATQRRLAPSGEKLGSSGLPAASHAANSASYCPGALRNARSCPVRWGEHLEGDRSKGAFPFSIVSQALSVASMRATRIVSLRAAP
jgi:hypothetical protein